jgi:hypothetical protein
LKSGKVIDVPWDALKVSGGISPGIRSPGIPGRNARQKAQAALFFIANLNNF